MKDELVAGLFIAGGIGVLITYMFLYITGTINSLAKMFSKTEWRFWVLSMILTTTSVLAVFFYFSTKERVNNNVRGLFITGLTVFLVSAMLWSLSVQYIEQNNLNPSFQRLPLNVTALATIAILVSVVNTTNNWLLILAAAIIVFHHSVVDGIIWPKIHENYKIGKKLNMQSDF